MSANETHNKDGAKTKFKGYKRALEQLSMVLPYSILKMIEDNLLKIRRVPMTSLLYMWGAEIFALIIGLSGKVVELFVGQKA